MIASPIRPKNIVLSISIIESNEFEVKTVSHSFYREEVTNDRSTMNDLRNHFEKSMKRTYFSV